MKNLIFALLLMPLTSLGAEGDILGTLTCTLSTSAGREVSEPVNIVQTRNFAAVAARIESSDGYICSGEAEITEIDEIIVGTVGRIALMKPDGESTVVRGNSEHYASVTVVPADVEAAATRCMCQVQLTQP